MADSGGAERIAEQVRDLHPGAEVHSADGVHVGTLRRVIVSGDTWNVSAVVVEESRRFTGLVNAPGTALLEQEVVVPIEALAHAERERVDLSLTSAEVRRLRPYLTYHLRDLGGNERFEEWAGMVLQAPSVGGVDEIAGKAPNEIEVREGENVMLGHTGRKLGTVRDVVLEGGELVGVVVHPEGWFSKDVLLQIRFLARSDDAALFADITEEDFERLQPFEPHGR